MQLVDGQLAYVWAFQAVGNQLPSIPGPVLHVLEGDLIRVEVENRLDEPHGFAIPGFFDSGPIAPGETRLLHFAAPPPGTYMYHDPLNAPVNRVMGLHGALVVLPSDTTTPYARPTPRMSRLFNDLGGSDFPGDPWTADRSYVWMFWCVDPAKNQLLDGGTVTPAQYLDGYTPLYFTLNGKSGYFASHDKSTVPTGNVGQPALIRTLNAGLAVHSPHIHGNHVYILNTNHHMEDSLEIADTWTVGPGEIVDVLLPFVRPADAHPWPPSDPAEFPMKFPMHCHMEMSQTANGGNYPQGLITDWLLLSPKIGGPSVSPL